LHMCSPSSQIVGKEKSIMIKLSNERKAIYMKEID
jgi:hypothetical protein